MTSEWYVVSRFTGTRSVGGEVVPWPASVAHAKTMGGNLTACGLNVTTWSRLFHVAFPARLGDNCPDCLDAVLPDRARHA